VTCQPEREPPQRETGVVVPAEIEKVPLSRRATRQEEGIVEHSPTFGLRFRELVEVNLGSSAVSPSATACAVMGPNCAVCIHPCHSYRTRAAWRSRQRRPTNRALARMGEFDPLSYTPEWNQGNGAG